MRVGARMEDVDDRARDGPGRTCVGWIWQGRTAAVRDGAGLQLTRHGQVDDWSGRAMGHPAKVVAQISASSLGRRNCSCLQKEDIFSERVL